MALQPQPTQKSTNPPQLWRFYLGFYRGMKGRLAGISLLSMLQVLILVPVAYLVKRAFDEVIPQKNYAGLTYLCLIMLGCYLTSHLLTLFTRYQVLKFTKIAIQRIRDELIQKIYTLSRGFYTRTDRQHLHTTIVQDSERVDVMSSAIVTNFLPSLLLSGIMGLVLLFLDFPLFLLLALILPALFIIGRTLGNKLRHNVVAFHQKFENFSKGVAFILRMLDLTQIQTAEAWELTRQQNHHEELRHSSKQMAWLATAYSLTQNLIVVTAGLIILGYGGWQVIQNHTSLGDILAFYFAFALMREHLRIAYNAVPQIIAGKESLLKLYEITHLKEKHPYEGKEKLSFQGRVEFQEVSFAYEDKNVLAGINFSLEPGKTTVLIGPSGSGKSTLINLILGFYRPGQGQLLADGRPYSQLDIPHLRSQIGILLQDPMLFPGTLRENIAYGTDQMDQKKLDWAAELADAKEFIDQLPQGYDTPIGEQGVLLSGGQGQRIALARALLRQPSMLILDEPTNHLDGSSIHKIQQNLKAEFNRLSLLLVSHDHRIVREADLLYLLEGGQIIHQGDSKSIKDVAGFRKLFDDELPKVNIR